MEWLQDPLSWVLAALLLALIMVLHKQRRPGYVLPPPPGPRPLPIIGNVGIMGQLTPPGLAALARKHGGLMHLRLAWFRTYVVSTPEYAREVLQAQDSVFSDRPATVAISYLSYGRNDMAFADHGPFWRHTRKLCIMKLFSRRRSRTWLAVRQECAELVRAVAAASGRAEGVNLGKLMFRFTNNVILRAAYSTAPGQDNQGHDEIEIIGVLREFSDLFGAFSVGDVVPWFSWMDRQGINRRLRAARGALDGFLEKIIDEHVERGRKPDDPDADMVDGLLEFLDETSSSKAAGHGQQNTLHLTRKNIKAICMDIMVGGTDTVALAVEWAMAGLLHNPDVLMRLQKELADVVGLDRNVDESDLANLPFLKCVVKETLRLHPPIPLLLHKTAEDCTVGGYSVPRGSRVMVNVWAIGRDGEVWEDADKFCPTRFMPEGGAAGLDMKGGCFELLPFGSGRRSCPGMALGQYAMELTVAQLVHGFDWELPNGMKPAELDMGDRFGLTAPRAFRLSAVPTPRLTCSV
uniref:Uncharacterized protein n=1 Tax=Avena sativa TaxID=4498 RepID=A0ACD6AAZ1_AVESA